MWLSTFYKQKVKVNTHSTKVRLANKTFEMGNKKLVLKNISLIIYSILFLYFSYFSFKSYYKGYVVYETTYSEEDSIPFPSVTLCPSPQSINSISIKSFDSLVCIIYINFQSIYDSKKLLIDIHKSCCRWKRRIFCKYLQCYQI